MEKLKKLRLPKTLGGILIVAGTAIGAGMLALPVVSAAGGFLPASLIFFLCWLFSASTGLLLLEVCQWMPKNANLVTMATHLLGRFGKYSTWVLYLFLFYMLTIAYTAVGGNFVHDTFNARLPFWLSATSFTLFFGFFVYLGTRFVDRINTLLMLGLVVSYLLFIFWGRSHINFSNLTQKNWGYGFLSLPVMFTSFSYQGVIPSLNAYLEENVKKMRLAILIGSSIPFITYVIWEMLILGILPLDGPNGLLAAKAAGQTAIDPLKHFLRESPIYTLGQFFGFFALTTSFLGVTLGLLDFFSDSLEIEKTPLKKLFLAALIYLPPLLIVVINPAIFLNALAFAGGIGCALLLGLIPILMVYVGRYKRHFSHLHVQLPGGKPLLFFLALFVVAELIIVLIQELLIKR
ncbi:MAG: aromatic amino acid transport family protein [Simkaniaceae bacterium]